MSQTLKERAKFQKELMPFFKIKNAICEITQHDASKIVMNKIVKEVYFVDCSELRFVCKLMFSEIMELESEIDPIVRATYDSLMMSP